MSTTGRALIRGGAVRVIAQITVMLVGLILLPFILESLGDRLYGAWIIIGTVIGYYGLLDLGLSSAVGRFVSRALGRSDDQEANGYIVASFYVFCAGGGAALIITGLVIYGCGWFISDPAELALFRRAFLFAGCAIGFALPSRCFDGVLTANLRYDLQGYLEIVATVLRSALIVAILLSGGGIVEMALAGAVVALLRGVLSACLAWRIQPTIHLGLSHLSRDKIRELFGYAVYTFIAQISDLLRFNAIPFVITAMIGLAEVTPFAIADRLRRAVSMTCAAVLSNLMPVFSRQDGRGDFDAIRRTYLFAYKIACYIGLFLTGMVFLFGSCFIERWIGAGRQDIVLLLQISMIGLLFGVIQIPTVNLLFGTSRNRFYAITNAIQGLLTIAACAAVIRSWELPGVMLSIGLINLVIKLFVLAGEACRFFALPLWRYHLRQTLPNLLRPALFLALAYVIVSRWLTPDYLRLALIGSGLSALYGVYIMSIGFTKTERSLLLSAIGLSAAPKK